MVVVRHLSHYLVNYQEAWNYVHHVHKQVFQGTNLRKQCFEGFLLVRMGERLNDLGNCVLY